MFQKKTFFVGLFLALALTVQASQHKYGEFTLKQGEGYVVRSGKKIQLQAAQIFTVFNEDLIKLQESSNGVLVTNEKATIDLGSNAVLKVRSWAEDKNTGFLSLLYGKIRASIAGLRSDESFNIKTANSVIGVKGTAYSAGISYEGDSYVWTISDYTYFTDSLRKRQMVVPNGYYSTNLKSEGLQKMVAVKKDDVEAGDLDSAIPGEDKKASFSDSFFAKRSDVGALPFINRQTFDDISRDISRTNSEIKAAAVVKINLCAKVCTN